MARSLFDSFDQLEGTRDFLDLRSHKDVAEQCGRSYMDGHITTVSGSSQVVDSENDFLKDEIGNFVVINEESYEITDGFTEPSDIKASDLLYIKGDTIEDLSSFDRTVTNTDVTVDGGRLLFNGTSSYLRIPKDAAFDFAGDFTIELYFESDNTTAPSNSRRIITFGNNTDPAIQIFFSGPTNNELALLFNGHAETYYSDATLIGNGPHHIAIVRSGTNINLYFEGSLVKTITNSTATQFCSQDVILGHMELGNGYFDGYMSNIRISNIAEYTENFDPATKFPLLTGGGTTMTLDPVPQVTLAGAVYKRHYALMLEDDLNYLRSMVNMVIGENDWTAEPDIDLKRMAYLMPVDSLLDSDVLLLLESDNAQGEEWVDSAGRHTFTGGPKYHDTNITKYDGSDKSSLYVETAPILVNDNGDDWILDDFTVDFWYYKVGSFPSNGGIFSTLSTAPGSEGISMVLSLGSNGYNSMGVAVGGTGVGGQDLSPNTWYHIALTRESGTVRLYVNGQKTHEVTNNDTLNNMAGCRLCSRYASSTGMVSHSTYFGYLRVSNVARWTEDSFDHNNLLDLEPEPEVPVIDIGGGTFVEYDNTILSLKGRNFKDGSVLTHTVNQSGAQKNVNDAYSLTDPSYISVPYHSVFDFGINDFTIEFRINLDDYQAATIVDKFDDEDVMAQSIKIAYDTGIMRAEIRHEDGSLVSMENIINEPPITFTHYALVRESGTYKYFVDGILIGEVYSDQSIDDNGYGWLIGGARDGATDVADSAFMNGDIKDFRISDVARYSDTFDIVSLDYGEFAPLEFQGYTGNLAIGASATGSPAYEGAHYPSNAIDGSLGFEDRWQTNMSSATAVSWLRVQLPSPEIITRVGIMSYNWSGAEPIKNFYVQGSNDGSSFTNLYTGVHPQTNSNILYYNFTNETEYLYYRLYITSNYSGVSQQRSVWEFQLFGEIWE